MGDTEAGECRERQGFRVGCWRSSAGGRGGGLLPIPALGLLFGLDQQLAQGTALVMVVPNVLLALWRYHQRNRIDWRHALLRRAYTLFLLLCAGLLGLRA